VTRFLFFVALSVTAYFMLRGRFERLFRSNSRSQPPPASPPCGPKPPTPTRSYQSADVVADPVCGTFVDPAVAISLNHDGRTLFFCSTECREKFLAGISH